MALSKIALNTQWLKSRAIVGSIGALAGGAIGASYGEDLKSGLIGATAGSSALLGLSAYTRGKTIRKLLAKRNAIKEGFNTAKKDLNKIQQTPFWKRNVGDFFKSWGLKSKATKARKEISKIHEDIRYLKNEALF